MSNSITILPSESIDNEKWDHCITENDNGPIYSTSIYLNHLAANWHGLVIGDYNAVMPLPWKKKMGIRYYYVPPFIQQLGITGTISAAGLPGIIAAVNKFASYGDIHFNFSNTAIPEQLSVIQRTNFLLDLSAGYEKIAGGYKADAKDNIIHAENNQLIYKATDAALAIRLYKDLYYARMPRIKEKDYAQLTQLCIALSKSGNCITRSITTLNGEIVCSAVLLKDKRRIYNIANAVTKNSRPLKANSLLYDRIIREFAGTNLLLDMEGSDLPGVKQFYEKFGVTDQPYFHYHHNRLPAIMRYFKP